MTYAISIIGSAIALEQCGRNVLCVYLFVFFFCFFLDQGSIISSISSYDRNFETDSANSKLKVLFNQK